MAKFYISDLHLGHTNALRFDCRPWDTLDEMHTAIIERWNAVVSSSDDVYIIGDAIWNNAVGVDVMKQLNGRKHLVRGNHDRLNHDVKELYVSIDDYSEISDEAFGEKYKVIMSHYPMPFYRSGYDSHKVMLCGHVHNSKENAFLEAIIQALIEDGIKNAGDNEFMAHNLNKAQIINVGCMLHNYTPQTLEQPLEWWLNRFVSTAGGYEEDCGCEQVTMNEIIE